MVPLGKHPIRPSTPGEPRRISDSAQNRATAFDYPRSQRRGIRGIETGLPVATLESTDSDSFRNDTLMAEKAFDGKRVQE